MKRSDRRKSALRRQINEAFCDPNGTFSIGKFLAVWAQIVTLAHFGRTFDVLILHPETMLIVLAFLIAPDIIKKALVMKLGGSTK